MTDRDIDHPDDAWLTPGEIAAELRLHPATVRSWISRGTLRAKRAGQRKLLVRRSELERMLAGQDYAGATPPPPGGRRTRRFPDSIAPPGTIPGATAEEAVDRDDWLAVANGEWNGALRNSQTAPPDPDFASRIKLIAEAAARRAGALAQFATDSDWTPIPGSAGTALSHELSPDAYRPGPEHLWQQFDQTVERLGHAVEGTSISDVQTTLEDLSLVMHDLADAIEQITGGYPFTWETTDPGPAPRRPH